jgi:hypothetical protein
VLEMVKESMSGVHMQTPVEAIVASGRIRRRRRLSGLAVAGVAVGVGVDAQLRSSPGWREAGISFPGAEPEQNYRPDLRPCGSPAITEWRLRVPLRRMGIYLNIEKNKYKRTFLFRVWWTVGEACAMVRRLVTFVAYVSGRYCHRRPRSCSISISR